MKTRIEKLQNEMDCCSTYQNEISVYDTNIYACFIDDGTVFFINLNDLATPK